MVLFSVITVTKNSGMHLKECLASLEAQTYKNFECIWIDSNSSDNTIDIFNNSELFLKAKLIVENDDGIYFAFNKGIKYCKGKYILILNSDDYLLDIKFLEKVSIILDNKSIDWVTAGIKFINSDNKVVRSWLPKLRFGNLDIHLGWMPPHSCSVISKDVYKSQIYNTKFTISSDYLFFLDYIKKRGFNNIYCIEEFHLCQRLNGASNGNIKKFITRVYEDFHIRLNYNKFTSLLSVFKALRKISQLKMKILFNKNIFK
jgi:glycosyltransferase